MAQLDVVSLFLSMAVLNLGSDILKEIAGDAGWFVVTKGIRKMVKRDEFEKCFQDTLKRLETKYPEYVILLDMIKMMQRDETRFPDRSTFITMLRKKGATDEASRVIVGEIMKEFQLVILEKAKESS